MRDQQRQAATEAITEWLAHPHELGKRPNKIECMKEFDLHDMHYYIFRYKKSMLGKWLLGICGGYEDEESLTHCGHVFSQMEEYHAETAEEKAIEMVEGIRAYWMQQAEAAEQDGEEKSGPFISFVLLDTCAWDKEQFLRDLQEEWGIDLREGEEEEMGTADDSDMETLVSEFGGSLVTVGLMAAPVPDGEAEHNAATNYLWPEAVEVTKKHVAHLLVAVMPQEDSALDAGCLLVKMCDACLKNSAAIGVFTAGTVFQPEFYRDAAEVMKSGELPYLNWIYFGLRQSEEGWMSGYTYGLDTFGKDEIEVIDTLASPGELRDFLFDMGSYVLSSNVTLRDGETIGFSAEMKLPITRSEGFNLDGMTVKIGFRPAREEK